MFNHFRKKSRKPRSTVTETDAIEALSLARTSATVERIVAEWDAHIARSRSNLEALLVAAIRRSEPVVAQTDTDLSPIVGIWEPVEGYLRELQRSLVVGWSQCLAALQAQPSVEPRTLAVEEDKLHEEHVELELAFQAGFRQVKAMAAQSMMHFALNRDARMRCCCACGVALTSVFVGKTRDIECSACRTVQTVEPGQAFRVFAAAAARWVGEWDAYPSFQRMRRTEFRIRRYFSPSQVPMKLLLAYHASAEDYWRTVIGVEAHLIPGASAHIASAVESAMQPARKMLRNHSRWRAYEDL